MTVGAVKFEHVDLTQRARFAAASGAILAAVPPWNPRPATLAKITGRLHAAREGAEPR